MRTDEPSQGSALRLDVSVSLDDYVVGPRDGVDQPMGAGGAADGADVLVMGAGAAQSLLRADELDEMELHVVPVLLGQGRRLFDHLPLGPTELELTRVLDAGQTDPEHRVLHLRYRVRRTRPTSGQGS